MPIIGTEGRVAADSAFPESHMFGREEQFPEDTFLSGIRKDQGECPIVVLSPVWSCTVGFGS